MVGNLVGYQQYVQRYDRVRGVVTAKIGNGEVGHALTIQVAKFTKSATEKITAAGGTAETV